MRRPGAMRVFSLLSCVFADSVSHNKAVALIMIPRHTLQADCPGRTKVSLIRLFQKKVAYFPVL